MDKKYLIGIGGTGAKVIEAAVFLCAAGYGPDKLSIFLIDPDKGNGNFTRTKDLVDLYNKCKNDLMLGTKFFKTEINIPHPIVWNIFDEQNTTLADFIHYETMYSSEGKKDLADFASVLFSESELKTQLNEGFRGHPSIGAVVMANPPDDKDPWKMFWSDVGNSNAQNDVRVFLVGSVFGGTGAAGVPTIGSKELIKFNKKYADLGGGKSKVFLGGALVLPYFTFQKPEKSDTDIGMFVTPSDFPVATKAALQYYNEKRSALGFDQLYFIGDSLGQDVGKFSHGKREQANLPHYIEIVTALSAYDFFEQSNEQMQPEKYFIACRDDERVQWTSLPYGREEDVIKDRRDEFRSLIVTMTAFAYSLCTYGKEILGKGLKGSRIPDAWYANIDEKGRIKNPWDSNNKTMLDNFCKFSELFLAWICAIDDETGKVELIDRKKIIAGTIKVGETFEIDGINYPEDHNRNYVLGSFLKGLSTESPKPFSNFLGSGGLNQVKVGVEGKAAQKFINIFYEASSSFCKQNYK